MGHHLQTVAHNFVGLNVWSIHTLIIAGPTVVNNSQKQLCGLMHKTLFRDSVGTKCTKHYT